MLKRFAASLALSLALVAFGAPAASAQTVHCTGCTYEGSFRDENGDTWHVFACDECHEH